MTVQHFYAFSTSPECTQLHWPALSSRVNHKKRWGTACSCILFHSWGHLHDYMVFARLWCKRGGISYYKKRGVTHKDSARGGKQTLGCACLLRNWGATCTMFYDWGMAKTSQADKTRTLPKICHPVTLLVRIKHSLSLWSKTNSCCAVLTAENPVHDSMNTILCPKTKLSRNMWLALILCGS